MGTTATLQTSQVNQVEHKTLRLLTGAAPHASVTGCDAYEPAPDGFRACSAKPNVFAFALWRTRVSGMGITTEEYALGAFCPLHARAGRLRVRRAPAPAVRADVLSSWLAQVRP